MNNTLLRNITCAIIVIFFTAFDLFAAPRSLKGVVLSADDDEPIAAAVVRLNTQDWAATDVDGKFSFPKLEPGAYEYEVSYLGYETAKGVFRVADSNREDIVIKLQPSNLALKEVVVTASEGKMGSSSLIGQSAIRHLQAKSVEDMLQ